MQASDTHDVTRADDETTHANRGNAGLAMATAPMAI
jgi:hypothetical protein